MGLYLYLASALWVYPGTEGEPGGPGDAFYWFFALLPILVIYLIVNSIALVAIVRRMRTTGKKTPLLIWLVVVLLWLSTVVYDHHRAFRVINAEYSLRVYQPAVGSSAIVTATA